MSDPICLDGTNLTPQLLGAIADGNSVAIATESAHAMARGRAVVDRYFEESIPAYGLTTGLGMRADRMLSREEASQFSYRLVRGRAQGVGEPLGSSVVRAILAVRLNTMLSGAAGASPSLANALVEVLNRNVVAYVPSIGSIGAGDLVVMSAIAHALIGEGDCLVAGERRPALATLREAGLEPIVLHPKDGLVLCNSTALSVAMSALAAAKAAAVFDALQRAAALSLEAFVGNGSPFDTAVLRSRPVVGQVRAGDEIRNLLRGGNLLEEGVARRLQDPVSFRCIAQTHGVLQAALEALHAEVNVHLNSSPDNPVVLVDEGRCVSSGNFHTPGLTHALDATARAAAWCANDSVSRVARLMHSPHSGLPSLLCADTADTAGFGPLLKPIEALRAEIIFLSTPAPILPSHNADGIEDAATFSPLAADKFDTVLDRMALLIAFELIAACQAIDLRRDKTEAGLDPALGPALLGTYRAVRSLSSFIGEDRPVGREVESIAAALLAGTLGVDE